MAGAYLNQSGWWDISVYVGRRGPDDWLADDKVKVSPPSATTAVRGQNPIPTLPPAVLLTGGLMALGGLLMLVGLIIIASWLLAR